MPPVVDLQGVETRRAVVAAIEQWGFFHVVNHGISSSLRDELREQMTLFFSAPESVKRSIARSANNSRGFADDEFTKQKTDAKQILDLGHKPRPDLTDNAPENHVMDGFNQLPPPGLFPDFRRVTDDWYANCTALSAMLAGIIADALAEEHPGGRAIIAGAFANHTSFLRLNYYPIHHPKAEAGDASAVLGVSRHTDAGFLTILLQDDAAEDGLEVYSGTRQDAGDGEWVPVRAVPGALTINTGDMLQVYSNGRFKAPEHRVAKSAARARYSAPFFYNPSYDTIVSPLLSASRSRPRYRPISWGQFRANRFKGDYADVGAETQIEDFLIIDDNDADDGRREEL